LCRAFNCRILGLYGLYLPTVILTTTWYSITHSLFLPRLKTFLFCKSFPLQPFLFLLQDSVHGFLRLFTVISEHICFLLFVFFCFLHFLVVGSVRWIKLTHVNFRAHVKIASRIVLTDVRWMAFFFRLNFRSSAGFTGGLFQSIKSTEISQWPK